MREANRIGNQDRKSGTHQHGRNHDEAERDNSSLEWNRASREVGGPVENPQRSNSIRRYQQLHYTKNLEEGEVAGMVMGCWLFRRRARSRRRSRSLGCKYIGNRKQKYSHSHRRRSRRYPRQHLQSLLPSLSFSAGPRCQLSQVPLPQ
jgi:hypothetical protein